ncbi:MAG TPA: hypothetical protein VE645_18945 [Pseudonocardiaceae bacterium]|jgi:hypothetical protein|nr:hypothetical protein [Pseudonocardiaceae bacterium]
MALRQRIDAEELDLADLMRDPPDAIGGLPLDEVIFMCRGKRQHARERLAVMGHCALRDGVNLLELVARADVRTRGWVADYDPWHTGPRFQDQVDACPFRVGDRIVGGIGHARPREVVYIEPGQYIVCVGSKRRRIAWHRLKDYRVA